MHITHLLKGTYSQVSGTELSRLCTVCQPQPSSSQWNPQPLLPGANKLIQNTGKTSAAESSPHNIDSTVSFDIYIKIESKKKRRLN